MPKLNWSLLLLYSTGTLTKHMRDDILYIISHLGVKTILKKLLGNTLSEKAYEAIRDSISNNEIMPNMTLSVDSLAKDLGVSQTPIREALARLSGDGLVTYQSYKGARVARITKEDVREIYAVRNLLEPYVARVAAENISKKRLLSKCLMDLKKEAENLRNQLSDFTSLNTWDYKRDVRIDLQLHEIFLDAVVMQNRLLGRIFSLTGNHSLRIRSFVEASCKKKNPGILFDVGGEHLAIIKALLDEDPNRAEELVRQHLHNGEQRTLRAVEGLL